MEAAVRRVAPAQPDGKLWRAERAGRDHGADFDREPEGAQAGEVQMDFVAGVSHELRTPLAVISSAAENIAHGVVEDKQQLVRYGNTIVKQTRQLTHLVEQVLLFAATQQAQRSYGRGR